MYDDNDEKGFGMTGILEREQQVEDGVEADAKAGTLTPEKLDAAERTIAVLEEERLDLANMEGAEDAGEGGEADADGPFGDAGDDRDDDDLDGEEVAQAFEAGGGDDGDYGSLADALGTGGGDEPLPADEYMGGGYDADQGMTPTPRRNGGCPE